MTKLRLSIIVVIIAALLGGGAIVGYPLLSKRLVTQRVNDTIAKMKAGDYSKAYDGLDPELKHKVSQAEFKQQLIGYFQPKDHISQPVVAVNGSAASATAVGTYPSTGQYTYQAVFTFLLKQHGPFDWEIVSITSADK